MLKYPLEYTTLANPKRIATASSLAGIILKQISKWCLGGNHTNLDICFQEMIDEGYLETNRKRSSTSYAKFNL